MKLHPLLSLLLLSGAAFAQGERAAKATDPLRPTGPVTVTADRAEWQDGGVMRYSGKVSLESETLRLSGDSLELRQAADGQYEASIRGAPARLGHAAGADRNGQALPPVSAEAKSLSYDSRIGVVNLAGGARMVRGGDEISGEDIRYNVIERRIQAQGGNGGQVKIIIQAPPPATGDVPKKP